MRCYGYLCPGCAYLRRVDAGGGVLWSCATSAAGNAQRQAVPLVQRCAAAMREPGADDDQRRR